MGQVNTEQAIEIFNAGAGTVREAMTNSAIPNVVVHQTPEPNLLFAIIAGVVPVAVGVWLTAMFINKEKEKKK